MYRFKGTAPGPGLGVGSDPAAAGPARLSLQRLNGHLLQCRTVAEPMTALQLELSDSQRHPTRRVAEDRMPW